MTWLDSTPAHWSTPPVYARYEVQLGKMLDERQITKRFLAPYLRNTDVQWEGINVEDLPEMDFDESEQDLYALRPGDILMCEGGEIGRCAIWDSDRRCFYQKALHRLRPTTDKDDPRYFVLVMRAAVEAGLFTSQASAATIQHLPAEKLRVFRYPAPPIDEQRAIVDRVSRLTAWLDALVTAKHRFLDLLAEKRKAIVATATTRGLDPKVKLRDSGVPWLGEIPAHWETERARWLFRERDVRSETGGEELLTVSHLTGVTPRSEKDVNMFEAETNEGYKLCEPGDLVINTLWAWMGAMGIAPVKGIVSPAYNVYEPGPRLVPAYIDALVRVPLFAQEVTRYSKGVWSSRLRLYPEGFFEVYLPVPPTDEQQTIVDHIARKTAKLDAMRAATERTVALLNQRRSVIIASAVMGQLSAGAAS